MKYYTSTLLCLFVTALVAMDQDTAQIDDLPAYQKYRTIDDVPGYCAALVNILLRQEPTTERYYLSVTQRVPASIETYWRLSLDNESDCDLVYALDNMKRRDWRLINWREADPETRPTQGIFLSLSETTQFNYPLTTLFEEYQSDINDLKMGWKHGRLSDYPHIDRRCREEQGVFVVRKGKNNAVLLLGTILKQLGLGEEVKPGNYYGDPYTLYLWIKNEAFENVQKILKLSIEE